MTDTNSVILIGRLTQDAEVQKIGNGTAKSEISLAVNRSVKKNNQWQDEVSYFYVTIWGKTAENLKQYLKKGTQICVCGYLTQDRWEKDGKKESRIKIVADSVQLLGGGNKGGNNQQNDGGFPEDNPFGN